MLQNNQTTRNYSKQNKDDQTSFPPPNSKQNYAKEDRELDTFNLKKENNSQRMTKQVSHPQTQKETVKARFLP